jgi:hypothetical protein
LGCEDWPAEAKLILSALDAGEHGRADRRRLDRLPYRTRALLRLFSEEAGTAPKVLYTRDIHCRSLGFITPHRLPLGHGGTLEVPGDDGEPIRIGCTLLRCRETAAGWYEGAVYFNREQVELAESAR